jgi:ADP-ribose pyrophosphatase YjhB (NUDIX family)
MCKERNAINHLFASFDQNLPILDTRPSFPFSLVIKFCNHCGHPVVLRIPEGDGVFRHVCTKCAHIQYQNPRIIVGCIAEFDQKILLCRRAIEPRHGFWTLPAGFMENGESTAAGAARESFEEACAKVVINAPFALVSIAPINQVHLFYRAHLPLPEFSAGEESLAVGLFSEQQIPWDELAFSSVRFCLEHYFADRQLGQYGFHETELLPQETSY